MKSANATDAPTAPLEAAGRLAAGTVLGRYVLERRLGAGGFGVVWLAYDEKLERQVAVKAIPREGTGSSLGDGERSATVAEREARVAARLNHPGIVALYELAADEYHVYLVSELVEGRTLAELAGAGALADRDVARVGIALCDALAHAHERGVIHRDVKPQNVMVVAEPAAGAGFAKLADFGVAHLAGGDPLTRTGDVVGTLAYMAPEQADGERVSPASDVYSLALTLYEAWAGVNPVRGKGAAATARRVGRRLPSLGARRRDLPAELAQVVDAALDPRPERRPALGALRRVLARAEADLSGEGGLVEAETRERFGLTAARRPFFRRGHRIGRDPLDAGVEIGLPPGLARIAAGAGSALLVLAALERLGPDPPLSPAVAAVVAGALVALLPRAGWLLFVGALCAWLASPAAGREGTALVLLVVLGVTPLLLPRSGDLWSVPALAPLLGAVGLAPLFVGVAALASGVWRRVGLAAAGLLWLAGAEVLTGRSLLFGTADGTLAREDWQGSLAGAVSDALYPLVSSPALAPLVVWALFAAVLPLAVRGRFLAWDLLVAATWAAGLVAAHGVLGDLLAASVELSEARGGVAGAVLGALIVVVAAAVAPPLPPAEAEPAGAET